jgi:GSH-dependent disulfide-bond oxidoreductase
MTRRRGERSSRPTILRLREPTSSDCGNEHGRIPRLSPPKVWTWTKPNGGAFANINRPVAGPTHEKELPVGRHPLQLYSLGTPNGVKVTILLEELLAIGQSGAEYDAWLINIGEGDQFGSGFVKINPNSKIPALLDRSGPKPIRVSRMVMASLLSFQIWRAGRRSSHPPRWEGEAARMGS